MSSVYVILVTSSAPVDPGHNTYLIDATEKNITLTMPTPAGEGPVITFSRIDASGNKVTIEGGDVSETINGAATLDLNAHENVRFTAYNNLWFTILRKWSLTDTIKILVQ